MKILIVSPHLSHKYGGPDVVVEKLAINLAKIYGNKVDVISTNADFNNKLKIKTNCWIKIDNYRIRIFNCFFRKDFIFSFELLSWMRKNVKRYDFVQLHTVFSPMMSLAAIILQIAKVPYSITPHGIFRQLTFNKKRLLKFFYAKFIEKKNLEKAKFVHVLTENEKSDVKKIARSANLVVVANGIDKQIVANGINKRTKRNKNPSNKIIKLSKNKYILSLSQLVRYKNIDKLVLAFAKIVKDFPDYFLYIAGEKTEYRFDLERLIREKQIPNIKFLGFVDGADKKLILQKAAVFVLASEQEGFSIAVLEALMVGAPTIISTGCNFPQAGRKKAALIVRPEPEEIYKAIKKIITSPELAKSLSTNGKKMVKEKYNWTLIAKQLMDLMQN